MKKFLVPAIVIIALIAMILAAVFFKKDNSTSVFTAIAEKGSFEDVVTVNGTLIPKTKVSIMSEVMGKIEQLPFKEGDIVKKGDVVVVINGKDLESDVKRMEASLKISEIQVKQQQVEVERNLNIFKRKENLFNKKLISLDEFELAEINLRKAKLTLTNYLENVKQTKAQLAKANELLAKTVIKSPMDGKITLLNKEIGEQVIQGTINISGSVIMEISDMSSIELEVEINEVEASRIEVKMDVKIELDAIKNKVFKGKVLEIGQSAYKPAGKDVPTFRIKLKLVEVDKLMKPGMSGRADILVLKKENVLTIPIEAVQEESENKDKKDKVKSKDEKNNKKSKENYCFKIKNGIIEKVKLKTGTSNDSLIEILKGLKENDKVVAGPYRVFKSLKDGDKIKEKKED